MNRHFLRSSRRRRLFSKISIYHHVFDRILLHSLFGIVPSEHLLLDTI
ncbi:hypothetical protein H5410_000768 [Solanum commersonii]|uniref:Uncharacterized protein n=1 Tax=Solanum commersonii TaxID=4109 RepID=A0A9J6AXU9_SOLCO|nr:hypothetical protein H5410_000768 [Solanum commersonii]